jgi:hypothetical protein
LHFVHPNAVAVIAHIPWLLWAIDVVLVDSRRQRVALATALIALLTGSQLLLGYPQYVWFSLLAETSYAFFLETTQKYAARSGCDSRMVCNECVGCAARTWPRVVIAKGIGLLIGGIQLLPSLDAWLHSARMSADTSFALWGSLHPLNLLQLVAPYLFTGRVIGDSSHAAAAECMDRGPETRTWLAGAAGVGGRRPRHGGPALGIWEVWLSRWCDGLAAVGGKLPLPLPLPGALSACRRRGGGSGVRAVDP